jgi:hypothetical protein
MGLTSRSGTRVQIELGKILTLYGGMATGLALRKVDDEHYLCSYWDGIQNCKEVVHVQDIVAGGRIAEIASTKNEVEEKAPEGCESGALD